MKQRLAFNIQLIAMVTSFGTAAFGAPSEAEPASDLVVVAGGRLSCGSFDHADENYMAPVLEKKLQEIADVTGRAPEFFLSCFGRVESQAGYVTSDAPDDVVKASPESVLEALVARASALATANQAAGKRLSIYLTGHSYGGWLVMMAVLKLPETVDIRFLATVDPISPVTCEPRDFARYVLGELLFPNLGRSNPGCDSAPADIGKTARQAIKARVGFWLNQYQQDFRPLHSGPIAEADFNDWVTYGTGPLRNQHDGLANDDAKQDDIVASMADTLNW